MLQYIALPVVGCAIGLLIISLGGGGGAIYVGILTVFFHVPPAVAATTSLATIIPTAAMGAFSHWRAGNVKIRLGLVMLIGGIAGSVAGSLCSGLLPESLYNKVIGVILLLLCAQMIISALRKRRKMQAGGGEADKPAGKSDTVKGIAFGLLGGMMSGIAGLSGGTPIIAGLTILGCGALEAVGTSVFVLVGISAVSFLIHLGLGNVDWALVGLLSIGTVSGAFLGPVLLKRLDKQKLERVMQPVIAVMIVAIAVMQLFH